MDKCRAWRGHLAKKSWGVYNFTRQEAVSQKPYDVCNKAFRMALKYIENCWSRVSFVTFDSMDGQIVFKILQSLTAYA